MKRLIEYINQSTNHAASDRLIEQFETYYNMLIEKNKVMNLTAITERDEVVLKHFIDSLAVAEAFPDIKNSGMKVLDLGTGAGFPGVPLSLVFPQLKMTLFDSLNKRILFLQDVIRELSMQYCTAVHGRAEEAARKKDMREQYDLVVSRAVASLPVLSEYCIPFVKPGGYFISYKTSEIEDELKTAEHAIQLLGGSLDRVEKIPLPESDILRSFVIIKKEKRTDKAYPRKAGTASRNPLS